MYKSVFKCGKQRLCMSFRLLRWVEVQLSMVISSYIMVIVVYCIFDVNNVVQVAFKLYYCVVPLMRRCSCTLSQNKL